MPILHTRIPTADLPNLTIVPRHRGTQGADGTAFLSYYDADRMLSFVWDGLSDTIEVSWGGYAEPVTYLAPAPALGTTVGGFCTHIERTVLGR